MRRVLAVLLALAATPAAAETYATPERLLEALYAHDATAADPDAATPYAEFFSGDLNAAIEADREATPDGEVGALDFDPVIDGQDGAATDVEIGVPIVAGDVAEVEVSFTNGRPVTLYYTLRQEDGGWTVDDIAQQEGEYPWGLRALLAGE